MIDNQQRQKIVTQTSQMSDIHQKGWNEVAHVLMLYEAQREFWKPEGQRN